MKFHYQEQSLKPGIYKILNTHTNRIYVGQAKELKSRWRGHRSSLLSGKHKNAFLLNDFNKTRAALGHDNFLEFHVLEILEGSTKEERNEREEWWIGEAKKAGNCYNFLKGTSQTTHSFKNRKSHSKVISETMKAKWQDPEYVDLMMSARGEAGMYEVVAVKAKERWQNKEFKHKIGIAMKSEKAREKRKISDQRKSEKYAKTFGYLVSPDGEMILVRNLTAFSRERNLARSGFQQFFKGTILRYKGWRLPSGLETTSADS